MDEYKIKVSRVCFLTTLSKTNIIVTSWSSSLTVLKKNSTFDEYHFIILVRF